MLPYSPTRKCSKCGNSDITTIYHDGNQPFRDQCRNHSNPEGEHLVRFCTRCRYEWAEAVIGSLPKKWTVHF